MTKKKEEEVEEDLEDEEETEEETDEEIEAEEEEEDQEEEAEEEETAAAPEPKKTVGISKEQVEALKRRNTEINLLHNEALFRYELLSQLLEINESLKKFLSLLTKKDEKGK